MNKYKTFLIGTLEFIAKTKLIKQKKILLTIPRNQTAIAQARAEGNFLSCRECV